MHHYLGLKHKHLRREQTKQHTPLPAKSPYLRFLDRLTLVAGIAGPFTALPQVYQIFSTHQAAGVSVIAWILMSIVTLPWIFYGIAHKDAAIIASFVLWEIVNLLVVLGAVLYAGA